MVLDFTIQAILENLQSLKIGRSQRHETQALADGVAKLRLVNLEIHSSPWVSEEDDQHCLTGDEMYYLPLMLFIHSLARRNGPSLLPSSSPSSPEALIVRDSFDVVKKSTKQIYFDAACRDCWSPRRIESTHPTREQACELLSRFGWQSVEERFTASQNILEHSLERTYSGVAEFLHMTSPCLWEFAFVRDPDDVLESAEGYTKSRSEDVAELRAAVNDGNGKPQYGIPQHHHGEAYLRLG